MKPMATALGVCALFLLPVAALAVDFAWDGGARNDDTWSAAANWDVGAGYPDDPNDTATITTVGNGWPQLDEDYTAGGGDDIGDLTMGGSADLDVNSFTLEVTASGTGTGTFTVNSGSTVTISNSSTGGGITASSIVINGSSTVTVSGTTTVQTT